MGKKLTLVQQVEKFGIQTEAQYEQLSNDVVRALIHQDISSDLSGIIHVHRLCVLLQDYEHRQGMKDSKLGMRLHREMALAGWFGPNWFCLPCLFRKCMNFILNKKTTQS